MRKAKAGAKRKTIPWAEFRRLCVVNSPKVPLVEIDGKRCRWVGIGVIEEGPADGTEVLVVPDKEAKP